MTNLTIQSARFCILFCIEQSVDAKYKEGAKLILLFKNISKIFIDRLLKLLFSRTAFWSSGLHEIVLKDDSVDLQRMSEMALRNWLVIISREEYFETVKDYPVGSLGDLKKIIRNEAWRFPFDGKHFFRAERLSAQSHRVTSWVIKHETIDALKPRPLWVIPETAGFIEMDFGGSVELQRLDCSLFVARTHDGLLSSLGQRKAFARAVAGTDGVAVAALKSTKMIGSEAVEALVFGAYRLVKVAPHRFFLRPDGTDVTLLPWRKIGIVSGIFFAVYMALTSGYLLVSNNWVEYRLVEIQEQADRALALRGELGEEVSRASEVKLAMSKPRPLWIAWDLYLGLKESGVIVRAVNSANGRVTFFLTATKGTEVLEMVTSDPRVLKAEFARPVKQVRDMQQFAIEVSFDLNIVAQQQAGLLDSNLMNPSLSEPGAAPKEERYE